MSATLLVPAGKDPGRQWGAGVQTGNGLILEDELVKSTKPAGGARAPVISLQITQGLKARPGQERPRVLKPMLGRGCPTL